MASTKNDNRRPVSSGEGLEVDPHATGIHELPESLGIEATPGELCPTHTPQTVDFVEKERGHDRTRAAQLQPVRSSDLEISPGSRPPGNSKRFLPLLVTTIIVAVIVLALAIPLGLQLRKGSKPSSQVNSNPTTRVPNELSTSGAFNGTGLAFVALDLSVIPDVSLFYQDNKSHIRRLHSIENAPFTSGFPIVASNARNATPLTTLTYPTSPGNLNSHLYYVGVNNTLQEMYSTDNFTTWIVGSLGEFNFTASASSTALTAFYSDRWLGQDRNSSGVRLYYGAPDNNVHELALFPNISSQYISQFVFPGTNGNAGIASGWWDGPGFGSLYMFDENSNFQIWSNSFNSTYNPPSNVSYGNWLIDPSETSYSVKANTALSYGTDSLDSGGNLCFQQTSNELTCSSVSSSDGSLLPPSDTNPLTSSSIAMQGSALVLGWLPTPGEFAFELNIFYQTENGDVIQNADATGVWVNSTLPVR